MTTTATTLPESPAPSVPEDGPPAYRWRWAALFVILAVEVMDLLDVLVTNIAGPSIRADLGGSASVIQWLGAGYTLAMAVGMITGGRLGDLYGRKRMFLIGAAGFVAASALCALAQSPELLVGTRVLQGLFGAVMLPQGLGLIKEMFPPKELGAAFGAFGPVMALSAVGGPILAGWLVDADLWGTGWRMIFLINVPLGLAALVAAVRFLPESRADGALRLDLTGAGLVSAAAALLIYPLVQGRELGWPLWTFGLIAASVLLFAVFGRHQVRRQRAGRDTLVLPSLFRRRAFSGGLIAGLAFFAGMMGFNLVFSLYIQVGLGFSPFRTGLASVPSALGIIAGFGIASGGGLVQRFGRRLLQAGIGVMVLGCAGFAVTLRVAGTDLTIWQLAPGLAVFGIGMGLVMAPFFDIILAGVEEGESGSASGLLNAVQQFGGALGLAVLGTLFFDHIDWTPTGVDPVSFADAVQLVLMVEIALLAVTFLVSFVLPKSARPGEGH
ncbi:EmrB/QacA subfamily drug resistance transporter [Allocatelliglobosispora scoriae]|uniref:EmrB/QacA subfamily drug resistance transporter n=1 Tax=Allocatelliglobosispora scoriae TaxID=643052 RepID=A0A841C324_9ACTN|nr:MFS transporter [Allocatelliglobosispora scoriae]MBB5873241.1 EmrB/QacA subfamily drug resistance transporter [Allocatelliglobosispora scoriae]